MDLSETDAAELDEMSVQHRILEGHRFLVSRPGIPLNEAIYRFAARYGELRALCPERFSHGHEEYWAGFYS